MLGPQEQINKNHCFLDFFKQLLCLTEDVEGSERHLALDTSPH